HSRLVKVKAGPSVKPGSYPLEPDVAESWTRSNDTTYVFKLRKDVRWHNKPPVNGRELTADDVKYTYDRFLTIAGNPNRQFLETVDRIDVLDRHTVRFVLKEPSAWFLDMLASTATWLVARESVEYPWPVMGLTGFKLDREPFRDVRVRRALSRATSLADIFDANAFSLGHYVAQGVVPAALGEWSVPIDQLGPEGRKDYQFDTAE